LLKRNRKNASMQLYTHRVQPSNGHPVTARASRRRFPNLLTFGQGASRKPAERFDAATARQRKYP
jgi:hypothetical protein